jgi:polyisoprenoid-binding protein YceI
MPARTLFALVTVAALLVGVAGWAPPASGRAPAGASAGDVFTVDVAHSTLTYRVRHFGVSYFHGRINQPSGSFSIDGADPAGGSVHVVAEIRNMDTGNDGRDRFLTSPDFFNAREFPEAEFRSDSVRALGDGAYEAAGAFTLHGVTRPLTVRISEYTTLRTERFGLRAGFECTFTVRRSDFGMDLFVEEGTLGDEVTITAAIEGVRQPS